MTSMFAMLIVLGMSHLLLIFSNTAYKDILPKL